MHVWDYKGISVPYVLLDPQREVAVLRRNREVYIPNGPWCVAGGIAYDTMNDAITAAP